MPSFVFQSSTAAKRGRIRLFQSEMAHSDYFLLRTISAASVKETVGNMKLDRVSAIRFLYIYILCFDLARKCFIIGLIAFICTHTYAGNL